MIEIKNLVKIYNKGKTNEFCALKGIDLSIEEGEMVAIIGKSGAGKSTLLHILAAIDSYDKGSYLVDGVSVGDLKEKDRARFRNQKIGIVMQDYALIDEYIEKDLSLFKRLNLDKKEIHCIWMYHYVHHKTQRFLSFPEVPLLSILLFAPST